MTAGTKPLNRPRYRAVSVRIWNDAKFRSVSRDAQLVFLFVLTHPAMTSIGALRASADGLAAELGFELKAFREAFQELLAKGFVKADVRASLIVAPKFVKHNPPQSPNVVKSWIKAIDSLPECALLNEQLQRVRAHIEGLGEGFGKAFREGFGKDYALSETETETETETNKEHTSASPPPPAPQEFHSQIFEEIQTAWNSMAQASDLPTIRNLSNSRKSAIRTRLKDSFFAENWRAAIDKIPESDFLLGKKRGPNGRDWRANFDWFLKIDNATKIIEGAYENGKAVQDVAY